MGSEQEDKVSPKLDLMDLCDGVLKDTAIPRQKLQPEKELEAFANQSNANQSNANQSNASLKQQEVEAFAKQSNASLKQQEVEEIAAGYRVSFCWMSLLALIIQIQ